MEKSEEKPFTFEDLVNDRMQSLRTAEQRLEVPEGTLVGLLNEPDHTMVIKIIATIEPTLNNLIKLGFTRPTGGMGGFPNSALFGDVADYLTTNLQLDGRTSKLGLASSMRLVTRMDVDFIKGLAAIRNRYAHNISNVSKTLKEMIDAVSRHDSRIRAKLAGIEPDYAELGNNEHKLFVVLSLARFLEDAERQHSSLRGGIAGLLGQWNTAVDRDPL